MNNTEYLELLEKYPQITSEGYGVNMFYANGMSQREYFTLRRDELKGQLENFQLCLDWLEEHQIEGRRNAHYWKDLVQEANKPEHPGYFHIPRGTFILAALFKGYDVTKIEDSTDAWISIPR